MNEHERIDRHTGTRVHIVATRQNRPNSPTETCPFCIGGVEAQSEYAVKSIANRWPALENGVCEVVLYSSQHDASLASLGPVGIRQVIDLWSERTEQLQRQDDINYVLIFENRGAQVGATIQHPHGQIYAFDHVPARQQRLLSSQWKPELDSGSREILSTPFFVTYAQYASIHPVSLVVAPRQRVATVNELSDLQRTDFSETLHRVFSALDKLFDEPIPYMMWINQSADSNSFRDPWMHMEIVSPWRAQNVQRFIAAAEVSTEEYFNPVDPDDIAQRLRKLIE